MGVLICLVGFVLAFAAARRSIGAGLCVVLTVGYGYGILRAHLPDLATYLSFDATVVGLYAGALPGSASLRGDARDRRALLWSALLCAWPLLLLALPDSSLLVRMVGLRAAVLLVPMVVIGARARLPDLRLAGAWLLGLNLVAFVVAGLEYRLGLEPFFPRVAATDLIYGSSDVRAGGATFLRIPSVFTSAHAFGGTMVATLPLVVLALAVSRSSARRWVLGGLAILATLLGVFLCGARQPVVVLGLVVVLSALRGGLRRQTLWLGVLAALAVALVVGEAERLQRFLNLGDTDATLARVSASVNEGFVDLLEENPFGRGLGSAVGTSMPVFLKEQTPVQVGLESEYSRLLIEQGVIGLATWLAFLVWLAAKRVHAPTRAAGPAFVAMQGLTVAMWLSALVGTGTLTSIPQSALVLLQMGVVAGGPWSARDPAPAPRRARPTTPRSPPPGWMPVPRAGATS